MGQDMSRSFPGSQCAVPQHADAYELGWDNSDSDNSTPRSGASSAAFLTPTQGSLDVVTQPTASANTVIIFDWDDTLLCSTAVNSGRYTGRQLKDLEKAVASILNAARPLGEVMIITNGNATWVQDSAKRYMPGLLPILETLTVVSARARCERRHPGDPYMWKKVAFEELLVDERMFPSDTTGLNIVALGDQNPEIEAAHNVVRYISGTSFVKTVKLREQPSVSELLGQLARLEAELPALAALEGSSYKTMARQQAIMSQSKNAIHLASAWKVSGTPKAESTWSLKGTLSMKDIWPLFS